MNKINTLKMRPYISVANSKLGMAIPTINLPYGTTCRKDAPCFKECYANKGRMKYKNFVNCASENLETYYQNPELYFQVIDNHLEMIPFKFFRWHSSGDIPDMQYLHLMCKLARKHKQTQFLCFTKKYEIVNNYLDSKKRIPKNLVIVFSNWGDWICPNPYNLPTAWVELKGQTCLIPNTANECSGYCGDCCNTKSSCWNLKKGESVVFKQH